MVEVNFSDVVNGNRVLRLDTQYFSKAALSVESKLEAVAHANLEAVTTSVGSFGAYELTNQFTYQENGIPFLRCLNIKNGTVNFSDVLYVSEDANKLLWKSEVKPEMVLLTMSGSVGNTAVALPDWSYPINSNQDIAKISVRQDYSPYVLAAFFQGLYGQVQMQRLPVGSVQQHIFLWMIEGLVVPRFSSHFQMAVEAIMKDAYVTFASQSDFYTHAETLLLDALGLRDWQPPQPLTYEQPASAAWAAGRLDAEHFQPQYAALFSALAQKGDVRLGDVLTQRVRRGISPEYVEDGDVVVINSRHVGATHVELESNRATSRALLNTTIETRGEVVVGDVLLNSTGRDTIGRCQCMLENVDAVADNHVAIIRPNSEMDPVYLACFLHSLPGQMQTEHNWTGSSGQIELRPDSIEDYRVWNAPTNIQSEIRSYIEQSHTARRQAKQLLESAKRAVEIAIEESESAALAFLEQHNPSS